MEKPSQQLRQGFYEQLDRLSAPTLKDKIQHWLGFSRNAGWLTASACLVLGLVMGKVLQDSTVDEDHRLAALEQQVSTLNRNLILDRLENTSPSKRLRGIIDAVGVVAHDGEIASAVLTRAVEDNVHSVRSAAIDALGPQLSQPRVADELMKSLEEAESPLVQFALVDLVLRYGSITQIERLLALAEKGRLHPDLVKHVRSSVRRNQV